MGICFERFDPWFSCINSAALISERWNSLRLARERFAARVRRRRNLQLAPGANKCDARVGGEADLLGGGGREGVASEGAEQCIIQCT